MGRSVVSLWNSPLCEAVGVFRMLTNIRRNGTVRKDIFICGSVKYDIKKRAEWNLSGFEIFQSGKCSGQAV